MPDWNDDTFRESPSLRPPEPRDSAASFGEDDDLDQLIVRRTPFPALMTATGILWILAGAAYVAVFGLLRLLDVPLQGNDVWFVFGAFFFIKDGIQLLRGKFRDPQVDGVLSILVAIFLIGEAVFRFTGTPNADVAHVVALTIGLFFGIIWLVPGILVLIGRKQYLNWLAEQQTLPSETGYDQ